MTYIPGDFVDLRYINHKPASGGSSAISKSSASFYEIGTQFMFRLIDGRLVISRRIPVAMA